MQHSLHSLLKIMGIKITEMVVRIVLADSRFTEEGRGWNRGLSNHGSSEQQPYHRILDLHVRCWHLLHPNNQFLAENQCIGTGEFSQVPIMQQLVSRSQFKYVCLKTDVMAW